MSNAVALKAVETVAEPIHNMDAEQALLGALLHNNLAFEKVSEIVRSEHFADPAHAKAFEIMSKLIERGQVADPVTLKGIFQQDPLLLEAGGIDFLIHLADSYLGIQNLSEYARTIYDLFLRRQLVHLGQNVCDGARDFQEDVNALQQIELAEKQLFDLATVGQTDRGFQRFGQSLATAIQMAEAAFKRDSHLVGVTSGLVDMDKLLGGLHPSDLIILAGRPSMGKTALVTNIAFNAACADRGDSKNFHVAFFSLEMSSEQLATRLLAQESGVSSDKIRRGDISAQDFPKFVEVSRNLQSIPLFIDDTPALSVSAIRTRARRLKRQHGLDLIVIDYLQLVQASSGKKSDNRVQEVSDITRSLKALAKELHVPVIALSQLSRAVEQRDDKRPQLADLRESGSIEQDADVVMFVFREEYYESRKEPPPGTDKHREWQEKMARIYNTAEVIVAKQRHGPISTVRLFFDGHLTKFGNLSNEAKAYFSHSE